jgi:hypothetical protein
MGLLFFIGLSNLMEEEEEEEEEVNWCGKFGYNIQEFFLGGWGN